MGLVLISWASIVSNVLEANKRKKVFLIIRLIWIPKSKFKRKPFNKKTNQGALTQF
jgi:hypothetical protein